MRSALAALALLALPLAGGGTAPQAQAPAETVADAKPLTGLDERISHYAEAYDVPESLVRRSIARESGFNPKARHGPYWGLMQIRYDTARGLGYHGPARGLLDADTNLKYACAYLANAYEVAGRNESRAISLYSRGYYWEARKKGLLDQLKSGEDPPGVADAQAATP